MELIIGFGSAGSDYWVEIGSYSGPTVDNVLFRTSWRAVACALVPWEPQSSVQRYRGRKCDVTDILQAILESGNVYVPVFAEGPGPKRQSAAPPPRTPSNKISSLP